MTNKNKELLKELFKNLFEVIAFFIAVTLFQKFVFYFVNALL